jgi:hypothetical protein
MNFDPPDPTTDFLCWLAQENGYALATPLPGERYACLNPRMYNTQILTGRIGDKISWDTAW